MLYFSFQIERLLKDEATEEKGERARMVSMVLSFSCQPVIYPVSEIAFEFFAYSHDMLVFIC